MGYEQLIELGGNIGRGITGAFGTYDAIQQRNKQQKLDDEDRQQKLMAFQADRELQTAKTLYQMGDVKGAEAAFNNWQQKNHTLSGGTGQAPQFSAPMLTTPGTPAKPATMMNSASGGMFTGDRPDTMTGTEMRMGMAGNFGSSAPTSTPGVAAGPSTQAPDYSGLGLGLGFEPKKPVMPEREKLSDGTIVERQPDGSWKAVYAPTPKTQPDQGYTLGEGQIRYGPGGKVIAKGPEKTYAPRSEPRDNWYSHDDADGFTYHINERTNERRKVGKWADKSPDRQANPDIEFKKDTVKYNTDLSQWKKDRLSYAMDRRKALQTSGVIDEGATDPRAATKAELEQEYNSAIRSYEGLVDQPMKPKREDYQSFNPAPSSKQGGGATGKLDPQWQGYADEFTKLFGNTITGKVHNGSVPNSYHKDGRALDAVPAQKDWQAAIKWGMSKGFDVVEHDAGSGLHLHFEPSPDGKGHYYPPPKAKAGRNVTAQAPDTAKMAQADLDYFSA